ncbi:MAG: response regulator [Planctomycetes bacterium]|nr:response regulator [Planctomycetota bacterium]
MRCLVVDDEPTARLHLRMLLSEVGEVDEVENAAIAIEQVREAVRAGKPYDVVCLDLSMPGPDGLETVAMIREVDQYMRKGSRTGVVVVTASSDAQDVVAAFRQKADAYLNKPVSVPKLDEALRKVAENRTGAKP